MTLHFTSIEELASWHGVRADYIQHVRSPYKGLSPEAVGARGARLYVIHDGRGFAKIGVSSNPQSRLRELATGNPIPLRVVFTTEAYARPYALSVEAAAHRLLSDRRCAGEWFRCGADEAVAAIYLAGGEGEL